jgi:predicted  nucleic acid-binding Zn-ribbon protein
MPLTMEDLERRISRLEEDRQQFMATIQAINTLNQAVAREFQFFRDAIIDHREELRRGSAELVARFERAEASCHALEGCLDGLEAKVDRNHAEVIARIEKSVCL